MEEAAGVDVAAMRKHEVLIHGLHEELCEVSRSMKHKRSHACVTGWCMGFAAQGCRRGAACRSTDVYRMSGGKKHNSGYL